MKSNTVYVLLLRDGHNYGVSGPYFKDELDECIQDCIECGYDFSVVDCTQLFDKGAYMSVVPPYQRRSVVSE